MRKSSILLIIGLLIIAVGAGLSLAKIEPYGDYVLIAGAIVVIIRGFVRNHEKDGASSRQTGGAASAEEGNNN